MGGSVMKQRHRNNSNVVPWGKAHPRRGLAYHDNAIAFLDQFPLETQFTSDSFNEWAAGCGLLNLPTKKYGDDWEGFRRAQHVLINNLRSAGRHPRMLTESPQGVCFDIENLSPNLWKVRP